MNMIFPTIKTSVILLLSVLCLFGIACGEVEQEGKSTEEIEGNSGVEEIDALSELIKINPDEPELYHQRATLYYEREVYREAIRNWNQAILLDSLNPEYYHRLSDAFMDDNAPLMGIEVMEDVVAIYPERIPSLLKLGELYLIMGYYDEAIQSFNRVIIEDPNNSDALFMKGLTFRDQGDTARAVRFLQAAIGVDPSITDAYLLIGQIFMEVGNPLAERYFDNAIRLESENPVVHHAKAQFLHMTDRVQEALEEYRKIHVQFPAYADAFYNAGLIYMEMDSIDNAYEMFDMAVEIKPAFAQGYYYRGIVHEQKGNYQIALEEFQQALSLSPRFKQAEEAVSRVEYNMGREN